LFTVQQRRPPWGVSRRCLVVVVGTYNWEDDFAGVVDGYAEGFEDFDLGVVAGGVC
jgi:23S rRNA A2030 N6-methylase RlmJ